MEDQFDKYYLLLSLDAHDKEIKRKYRGLPEFKVGAIFKGKDWQHNAVKVLIPGYKSNDPNGYSLYKFQVRELSELEAYAWEIKINSNDKRA